MCIRDRRGTADARLRGGAVGTHDLGHHADGVREFDFVRNDRFERALGERAVADLSTAGASQAFRFALSLIHMR